MELSFGHVNREIISSVTNFMKYIKTFHNISIDDVDISNFLCLYQEKRKFNPNLDTFMHICQYLQMNDIIKFTTICHEFMEYYPNIWHIINVRKFPLSIVQEMHYTSIKLYVSLDYYYYFLVYNKMKNCEYYQINECEQYIFQYTQYINNDILHENDKLKYIAYINQYIKERECIIEKTDNIMMNLLNTFRFNSLTDTFGNKYYTIKPEINCYLYGIDPYRASNKMLWTYGVYSDEHMYNFSIENENLDTSLFKYGYNPQNGERYVYNFRPDYC